MINKKGVPRHVTKYVARFKYCSECGSILETLKEKHYGCCDPCYTFAEGFE